MAAAIYRQGDKKWVVEGEFKGAHPTYKPALEKYLNSLDAIFCAAKEKSEFEFISTLLRVRGLEDVGWDTFETLQDVFEAFQKLKKSAKDYHTTTHYALFLYGLTVEASAPYEILANLLRIIGGGRYQISEFAEDAKPGDKIKSLQSKARKIGHDLSLFDEFYDNTFRNAIFHSDYTLYNNEVRLQHRKTTKVYKRDEWHALINRAQVYYEVLVTLIKHHRSVYDEPALIDVHAGFATHPDEKAITIIRPGTGVVALRDNWNDEQLKAGYIPWWMGTVLSYESKLINERVVVLPPSRVDRANKLPRLLLGFIAKRLVPYFSKKYHNRV